MDPNYRLSRLMAWVCLFFALAGCAGPAQVTFLSGTCEGNFDQCMTRCDLLNDGRDCQLRCRFRGRLCDRQTQVAGQTRLAEASTLTENAALVDLSTNPILHSTNVSYKVSKGVSYKRIGEGKHNQGAHVLKPGGTLQLTYQLPVETTSAELVIGHGPMGQSPTCFITLLLDEQTIVGRYSPPRSEPGRVIRFEKWDLSARLTRTKLVEGRRTFKIFLMNNGVAGSRDDYALNTIELYYQTEN
ncbi:MAG: hypothetical protein VYA30_16235 [Myxococcota bacterium]|nr:hypothetical protein [Myxococcota bacterium]